MKKIYNKNAREKVLLEEAYSKVYTEKEYCCGPKANKRLGSSRPARQGSERRLHSAVGGYRVGKGDPKVIRPQRNQWAISGDEEVPDPENISGERWSDEWPISDLKSTEDLEYAEEGDAFLFDKVDEFAQAEEEVIESESDVMDFLSRFGTWELKDNHYGAIVVKVGDMLRMQPPGLGRHPDA
tara:strand:- start:644 stop:1192 length:549 start_codon:yes stop_codon:yes gene_type:complete